MTRLISTLLLVASIATISACGRRGDLDTPYDAAVQARQDAKEEGQPLPPEPTKPAEDKPFFLDRLIR